MQVHHLNTGTMCPLGERFVTGAGSPFRRARLVCHVLLVELRDGLALVDGGIGLGDVADPARLGRRWVRQVAPRLDPAETAFEQVRARGFDPRDVRHVVVTHLDRDHAGCVPDFPWATVHVHARELAAARAASGGPTPRYIAGQLPPDAQVRRVTEGGETWFGFAGVTALDPREPDVLIVPLHGHTAGHCGVAVRGPRGWLLHAGDSYFFHGQLEARPRIPLALRHFQRRADTDRAAREHNQARVRELALGHPEIEVFCAHDAVEYDRAVARAAAAPRGAVIASPARPAPGQPPP
jgi:glyoxylase-like metal-dependent hydrolase (beta-lactamase superfamily II)